ncbi:MAG: hypothetical protein ABI488_25050 [Polyangiaceae bacterium]
MNKNLFALLLSSAVACGGTFQGGSSGGAGGQSGASGGSAGVGASAGHGGTAGLAGGGASGSGGAVAGGGGSGGSAAGAGGSTCGANCGFKCCGPECINTGNDINNCGTCGTVCPGPGPFCNNGKCDKAPCQGVTCTGTTTCCEDGCCKTGELCCNVNAGASRTACTPATDKGTCPLGCAQCVCTAPNTPIATPSGERPISELEVGDLVYSVHHGKLVAVPIILTNRVPVTGLHHMVEVRLSTGRVLSISPSHPTADGRTFADLAKGDALDGVALDSVRRVPYTEAYTYDILPDSDSGTYFAGGVLIGTTLAAPLLTNQSTNPLRAWTCQAGGRAWPAP